MRLPLTLALIAATALPVHANGHWPQFGDIITPTASGLLHSTEEGVPRDPLPFGSGFQEVMHIMVNVYGHDFEISFPQECGAGPLAIAAIDGQINLTFSNDQLAGWMLIGDDLLTTETGLRVGAPADILPASGEVDFFESGLGTEFSAGDYFGLLTEGLNRVQAVWVGTNCIFR